MTVTVELTKQDIEILLNVLENQISIDLDILFKEVHDPAGECFVVMLENLNDLNRLYIGLNALIIKNEDGVAE